MSKEHCPNILPKDAKPIVNIEQKVIGIATNDGSFDYTQEGFKFLKPGSCRIENAGITSQGIFINGD